MRQARRTVKKWVYFFGAGKAEGDGTWRDLLGGKGAGLAEMTKIGLRVPAGFTISTEVCDYFYKNGKKYPPELKKQVADNVAKLERTTKKKLGDPKNPLLVSVRSGAARSMPGMMETILNLGLNDRSVAGLAARTADPRFAFDAYRRFIQMYAAVVLGLPREEMDRLHREAKQRAGVTLDTEVTTEAVFGSWMAAKAVTYRRVERITGLPGTAVSVVQMVFGNLGDDSGTGVGFTRDPNSGARSFYG